jgi:hypothetical protein
MRISVISFANVSLPIARMRSIQARLSELKINPKMLAMKLLYFFASVDGADSAVAQSTATKMNSASRKGLHCFSREAAKEYSLWFQSVSTTGTGIKKTTAC